MTRLARLRAFLERSLARRETVPVSRLLLDVLQETGYGKLLLADESRGVSRPCAGARTSSACCAWPGASSTPTSTAPCTSWCAT
ncbi:MAG: hypothetical protein R3F62_21135 [Planctomycetota bacterium]